MNRCTCRRKPYGPEFTPFYWLAIAMMILGLVTMGLAKVSSQAWIAGGAGAGVLIAVITLVILANRTENRRNGLPRKKRPSPDTAAIY